MYEPIQEIYTDNYEDQPFALFQVLFERKFRFSLGAL